MHNRNSFFPHFGLFQPSHRHIGFVVAFEDGDGCIAARALCGVGEGHRRAVRRAHVQVRACRIHAT